MLPLADCTRWHWISRLSAKVVFATILVWQGRIAMFQPTRAWGWPIPFANLSDLELLEDWSLEGLAIDTSAWLIFAASTGFVVDHWLRRSNRFRFTIRGILAFPAVLAVLFLLARIESQPYWSGSRINPNFAIYRVRGFDFWFDRGLFTDPLLYWPTVRCILIVSIGCAVYTSGYLVFDFAARMLFARPANRAADRVVFDISSTASHPAEPEFVAFAEFAFWIILGIVGLAMFEKLLIPTIH